VFAISTSVAPKILLVDEVLAVGDAEFRKRSIRRLRRLADNAGSVVMVSHKMKQIRKVCNKVIWIDNGEVRAEGKPGRVVRQYKAYAKQLAEQMDV
jgi:teichoic acid transport system ATP-binding protein